MEKPVYIYRHFRNGWEQSATRGIGYAGTGRATGVDGFSGMDIQSVNAPYPYSGNYSQNLRFFTHYYSSGTGGTPRMFIQYNGNVGIGTITPSYTLDVNGTANITDTIFSRNIDNLQDQTATNIIPTITGSPTIVSNAVSPYRYRNGTYTFASSSSSYAIHLAFTTDLTYGWSTANNYMSYSGGSNTYTGSGSATTFVDLTSYTGDYIQIKIPNLLKLSSISYATDATNSAVLLGSVDGSLWGYIGAFTNGNNGVNTGNYTATFSTSSYYTYFRFITLTSKRNFARLYTIQMFGVIRSQDGNTLRLTASDGVVVNGNMTTQNITATGNLTYQPRYKSSWTAVNQSSGNVAFNLPFTMDFENLPVYKVLYCDGTSATPAFGNTYDITGSIKNYGGNTGMVIKYTLATQVTINFSVSAIAIYETSYFTSGRIRLILY